MSYQGLNMQKVQEALKTFYLPGLRYQMNEKSGAFYSQIEKGSQGVVGKDIVMALRYGRNGGVGNRADDGLLPTPNSRKTKQARWETKNIFARIQISDKVMKASAKDAGAFANLLETELDDAMTDAKDNFARQLFGDGTGVMATCGAASGVNVIPVSSTQFFSEGQLVDVCSSDGTPKATEREVTVVDHVAKKITLSGASVTTTATDIITIAGNYGLELTGLGRIFKPDTTIYNIDRSTNKWLNPNIIAVDGAISELDIQNMIDQAEIMAGSDINFLMASYGVRRAYQELLQSTKRYVNTLELKGGWKALDYNGIGLVADKYAPAGTIHGLSTENFKLYEMSDWDWMEKDGAVLSRVTDRAAYEATLVKYADLGCDKIKGQGVLTGITES